MQEIPSSHHVQVVINCLVRCLSVSASLPGAVTENVIEGDDNEAVFDIIRLSRVAPLCVAVIEYFHALVKTSCLSTSKLRS